MFAGSAANVGAAKVSAAKVSAAKVSAANVSPQMYRRKSRRRKSQRRKSRMAEKGNKLNKILYLKFLLVSVRCNSGCLGSCVTTY